MRLLALALLAACRRTPPPPATDTAAAPVSASASAASVDSVSPVAPGSASAEPGEPPPSTPDAALARASVQGDDIRRRTLFVWATAEQATSLRQTKLLADAFRAGGAPGLEAALRKAQDPTTLQLMRALGKERRPFALAWSNVWGTARRLDGGQLVQVTLRPDAVVGRYDTSRPKPWSFVDAKGVEVAPGKVMARPERLGAILHTTTGKAGEPVRGYALASERAITSWSMATPALDAELESAATLLTGLTLPDTPADAWPARVTDAWKASTPSYEATLSTATGHEPSQRPDLAARLRRAKASGAALSVKVSAARGGAFADLLEEGVQRQICTEHGDRTRCTPQPPSWRRAHDGRFCTDEQGRMVDCPARR